MTDAVTAVHDVFVLAHLGIPRVDGGRSFTQATLEPRRGWARQRFALSWLAAEQSSPSERAQRNEQAVLVAGALETLPEAQREALVLHYWQGWTLPRIAEHLQRTPAAIAGLLQRGLKELRKQLVP